MVEISTLQGKPIWVPHPQEAWVCGTIEKINGNNVVIAIQNGGSFTLSMKEMELADLANPSSLSGNFDNLVNLEEFNQGAIIHQLRIRYSSDTIYTWIGNILISINPFKPLSIYSNETLQKFLKKQKEGPGAFQNPVPHVYALAGLSYQGMSLDKEPQAFVISGESGSGKTETTKLILQYLSECAGSTTGVEQEILQTNPLLESFGNAKTLRNNNSSRFGKWMEIRFDPSGKISASRIVNYLLEKSRVIKQSAQERNYHIFYQMCAGSSTSRPNLSLDDPSYFNYLNQTGCMTIPGVDDEHDYREVISSMEKLGFSSNDIDNVHHIVASVLHLGNLEFSAKGEGSQIPSTIVLNTAAKLLRLTPEQLAKALCVRSVKIRNDTTEILLKPTEASDARHTLAKALFGRLFDWLVKKVNLRLCKSNDSNVIGVLDIFGFGNSNHPTIVFPYFD